jgi:hypothetical protein
LRVLLVPLIAAQRGEPSCLSCEAQVRIVPGCSFSGEDKEQFEELSAIVADGNVQPAEAQRYADEVKRALWSGAYKQSIERLVDRWLGLLPMQVAAGKNSGAQRRILIKLQTIFDALASVRARSGEYSTVADRAELGERKG